MIADLLRLASIGQNMELYATSLRLQQQQQQQLANIQHQDGYLASRSLSVISSASGHQQPLDLSVRQNDQRLVAANKQISTYGRQSGPTKLISSSTSPAGSSASSYSSISSCSSSSLSLLSSSELISTSTNLPIRLEPVASNQQTIDNKRRHSVIKKAQNQQPTAKRLATNQSILKHNQVSSGSAVQQKQKQQQKQKGAKVHLCNHCNRAFARSDMLTRHTRLHSGVKPYQCNKCQQVFSRSDHLSTHERTHTGEKPYQCEYCAYSACRRDMITRHMRTHSSVTGSSASRAVPTTRPLTNDASDR